MIFDIINQYQDVTVLTPNRRLAATLHKLYQEQCLTQQLACWQTPDILPLSTWIERLWKEFTSNQVAAAPLLLSPMQEQYMWEKILVSMKESEELLQIAEAATLAKNAWALLKQWRLDVNDVIFSSTEDALALRKWCAAFTTQCQQHAYIDSASLLDVLQNKPLPIAKHLVLIGFTEIYPQLQHFLDHCGAYIHHQQAAITLPLSEKRITLHNAETELETIARFAKSRYQQNNQLRIGCVIPNLNDIRDRVEQVFTEVFAEDTPFNISAGKPLIQYPVIHTALLLLGLQKNKVPLTTFSFLLASPYLGHAESERLQRSLLDFKLREQNYIDIDASQLPLIDHCPLLAKQMQTLFTMLHEKATIHTFYDWACLFNELLSALGWPGERSLNSEEYQVVTAWLKLLADFSSLDQIANPVNYAHALSTLQKITAHAPFQPQTPEAPIQVLGLLEAAGLPFDDIWIAGMDDMSWPPQPAPNPFIPKALQRQLQMPHATAERELHFCQLLLEQFRHNAKHIIYSNIVKTDKIELLPSHLIHDVTETTLVELDLNEYKPPSEEIFLSKAIEKMPDQNAPPILTDETIFGGSRLLQDQALCPFKAFATWRLHADSIETPQIGLRAKDRGVLVHAAMEAFWNQVQTQENLLSLDATTLAAEIDRAIDTVMVNTFNAIITKRYMLLEKERLHKLIHQWLQVEKRRPAFKVISHEKKLAMSLNGVTLSVRIDRIDELDNGSRLIIDYKTNDENSIRHWFSDRPEQPQLPLYALNNPKETAALAFAQLCPGSYSFVGLSSHATDIKGITVIEESKAAENMTWPAQLQQWQLMLSTLAQSFAQGHASIDPKDTKTTCTYCELKPLCRIHEEVCDDN